jgi:hypothetical protein
MIGVDDKVDLLDLSTPVPEEGEEVVEEAVEEAAPEGDGEAQAKATPEPTQEEMIAELKASLDEMKDNDRKRAERDQILSLTKQGKDSADYFNPLKDLPPDEIPTIGQTAKMIEDSERRRAEAEVPTLRDESERLARQAHTDFDDVIKYAIEITNNPEMASKAGYNSQEVVELIRSNNPKIARQSAQLAYLIGTHHPSYKKAAETKKESAILDKIEKNVNRPKTLANAPSKSELPENAWEMDDATFDREWEKARKR